MKIRETQVFKLSSKKVKGTVVFPDPNALRDQYVDEFQQLKISLDNSIFRIKNIDFDRKYRSAQETLTSDGAPRGFQVCLKQIPDQFDQQKEYDNIQ